MLYFIFYLFCNLYLNHKLYQELRSLNWAIRACLGRVPTQATERSRWGAELRS